MNKMLIFIAHYLDLVEQIMKDFVQVDSLLVLGQVQYKCNWTECKHHKMIVYFYPDALIIPAIISYT